MRCLCGELMDWWVNGYFYFCDVCHTVKNPATNHFAHFTSPLDYWSYIDANRIAMDQQIEQVIERNQMSAIKNKGKRPVTPQGDEAMSPQQRMAMATAEIDKILKTYNVLLHVEPRYNISVIPLQPPQEPQNEQESPDQPESNDGGAPARV